MDFDTAVARILDARSAVALFGTTDQVKVYRHLAKIVHPDLAPASCVDQATAAFAQLSKLWHSIQFLTLKGYQVHGRTGGDGLSDWFQATSKEPGLLLLDPTELVLLKMVNKPINNDLMRREADNLRLIYLGMNIDHQAFLPMLFDSFPYRDDSTDADRIVNVFRMLDPLKFYSLRTIGECFPNGLDGKHVAWIWRRLLMALGVAHKEGVIHGAVVPDNILVSPELHGLVLVNWCYSASGTQRVPALVSEYRDWYHEDVVAKKPPQPYTDVHLATRSMFSILDSRAPTLLRNFGQRCLNVSSTPGRMPTSATPTAWTLLSELNGLLEAIYGPRKFTEFPAMPSNTKAWPWS